MRKQTALIVAPLCAMLLAAGVATAAPSSGQYARQAKLDHPHVVRPIAASPSFFDARAVLTAAGQVLDYVHGVQMQDLRAFLDAAEARNQRTGDFLSCVKQRESHGNYSAHNYQDSGASGAYQFLPGTWNAIATFVGRDDLVGIDPAAASPADQDAMAAALYAQQGSAPWGGAC
jgi:hypothetical protein